MTMQITRSSHWPTYTWPEGRQSAFCFTVDVDAESPLLWNLKDETSPRLIGQLEQRLFGPRVGIWRLLNLLDRFGIKATFFVPGVVAENHPGLLPAFAERGHDVGLHGYFHEIVSQISDAEFTGALEASLEIFREQIGVIPRGFRSPAWEMTPHMLNELKARGFYDSSLSGFDHPYIIGDVVEVPVQWAIDDAVYFKFVGGGADSWPPSAPGPILDAWLDEWEMLHADSGLLMLTVHDWISGRAHRIRMLEKLLHRITAEPTAWITTVGEIASHHINSVNKDRYIVPLRNPEMIAERRFGRAD